MTGARERIFYSALAVLAVAGLWILPARASFWLDETATFWAIKDGLANTLSRPMYWSGQSPLYYLTAWVALKLGGPHEFVLRLPSLLAMLAAAGLLFRLAERLFDRATAAMAMLVFVCSDQVAYAAADARPYALGLALLTASALSLVRWLDSGRTRDAAACVVLSALTIYAHVLLAPALAVHGAYALYRAWREKRVRLSALAAAWLSIAILSLPLAAQLARFYQTRAAHSFSETPRFAELFGAVLSPALAAALLLAIALAAMARPGLRASGAARRENVLMAAGWALVPPLVCFSVSAFSETKLFVPRYYISAMPGIALLAGWLLGSLTAGLARRIVAVTLVAGAFLSALPLSHGGEDWAGAMRTVREASGSSAMPVLMPSGFVEAADPRALDDPKLREVLFAPLTLYPAGGTLVRLPYCLDGASMAYLERVLPPALEHTDRFLFVARYQGLTFEPWVRARMAPRGFRAASLGDFGDVRVLLFRNGAPR